MLLNTTVIANATDHILCELTRTYARMHLFPKLSRVHLFHLFNCFLKLQYNEFVFVNFRVFVISSVRSSQVYKSTKIIL
jgi:hypothetical protein